MTSLARSQVLGDEYFGWAMGHHHQNPSELRWSGGGAAAAVRQHRQEREELLRRVTGQLASALTHCHSHGVCDLRLSDNLIWCLPPPR